jgi:hypothetical protein
MTAGPPAVPTEPGRATPSGPPAFALIVAALVLVLPAAILTWIAAAAALRWSRVTRWHLAGAAVLSGGATVAAGAPLALAGALGRVALTPALLRPSWALLGIFSGVFVAGLPVGVPVGMAAAAVNQPHPADDLRPEWREAERRRRRRAEARGRRRARRLTASPRVIASDALAVALEPAVSLPEWRRGRLIVPPPGQLGLTTLLVGGPGVGKTTAAERIAELAARERRHLTLIDGKGTDGLAAQLAAVVLSVWPDARVRSFPEDPVDLWRGTPQQLANRLVACWSFSQEAEFYEQAAMLGLRLALTAPGPAVRSTAELVTRLEPSWLERAWQGHTGALSLIRGPMKARLGDVALRASNLAASLGLRWDGDWWLDDVDVALFTVPTLDNVKDSDAAMRVLIAAYGQYLTRRSDRRPSLLLFDEFSALQGGRPLAISLVERSRSAGSGVLLSAQSAAGLGDERERERLIAAANAVVLFRSAMPAQLAQLAGSERVAEAAWQLDGEDLTGRSTVTMRARGRVDQDRVRALRTGEAEIIAAGRVERARIIRATIPEATRTRALELVAGQGRPRPAGAIGGNPAPPDGPAGAVDERGLPGHDHGRQGQAPAGRPAAGLDPPVPGRVRRHRPPRVGEDHPPDDRNPEGLEDPEITTSST